MSDSTLVIGSFDCNDRANTFLVSSAIGVPDLVWNTLVGDEPRQSNVRVDDFVERIFRVRIKGSNGNDLDAWVNALRDQVPGCASAPDENTVTFALSGRTMTGLLSVHASRRIDVPVDVLSVGGDEALVEVRLTCDPYVMSAAQALHAASGIDAPAVVSLSEQIGQYVTPLDLLLDAETRQIAGCYVGHTSDETATIADFVRALAAATWSAGAASTDAAGWPAGAGNTIWRHTGAAYTDIDVTDLEAGKYLVLANCKGTTANTDTINHAYGDPVLIPSTTLRWLPLGAVSLPTRLVRGSATDTLRLTITGGGGGEYAAVNAVAFLPVSDGITGYVLASGHVHTLRWEDGTLYADDGVDLAHTYGGAAPLRVFGGQLVVLAEQATAAPTTHLHVTVTATPRWEQLPSTVAPISITPPSSPLGLSM